MKRQLPPAGSSCRTELLSWLYPYWPSVVLFATYSGPLSGRFLILQATHSIDNDIRGCAVERFLHIQEYSQSNSSHSKSLPSSLSGSDGTMFHFHGFFDAIATRKILHRLSNVSVFTSFLNVFQRKNVELESLNDLAETPS